MTKLEQDGIHALLEGSAHAVVESRYVQKLDSADFTLGWHLAHQRL